MKTTKAITWKTKLVNVADVKPTPNNYKIKTDIGKARLQLSLKKFGLAGALVVNTDLTLIDGNSRLVEAKEKKQKKIEVSMPSRKLTPKEFTEMSAMFDFAVAGTVDMERIEKDLGTKEDFYKAWGLTMPMELLAKIGKVDAAQVEYPDSKTVTKGNKEEPVNDIRMVNLFFKTKEEIEFRKMEEKFAKKFKTSDTTMTVFKALQHLNKTLK